MHSGRPPSRKRAHSAHASFASRSRSSSSSPPSYTPHSGGGGGGPLSRMLPSRGDPFPQGTTTAAAAAGGPPGFFSSRGIPSHVLHPSSPRRRVPSPHVHGPLGAAPRARTRPGSMRQPLPAGELPGLAGAAVGSRCVRSESMPGRMGSQRSDKGRRGPAGSRRGTGRPVPTGNPFGDIGVGQGATRGPGGAYSRLPGPGYYHGGVGGVGGYHGGGGVGIRESMDESLRCLRLFSVCLLIALVIVAIIIGILKGTGKI